MNDDKQVERYADEVRSAFEDCINYMESVDDELRSIKDSLDSLQYDTENSVRDTRGDYRDNISEAINGLCEAAGAGGFPLPEEGNVQDLVDALTACIYAFTGTKKPS